jgi:pimeloyl-ACP methyl ester carboxylesterase
MIEGNSKTAAPRGDSSGIEIRVHGSGTSETLIYLPGVHGDWNLIGGFRSALGKAVRFVEIAYPPTLTWSLKEYAHAVEAALTEQGIDRGWLLGESFGSQVVWEILNLGRFQADGIILAGGFARHPAPWMASIAAQCIGVFSFKALRALLLAYVKTARWRFRKSPETLAGLKDFLEHPPNCQAMRHRLQLVAGNDPSSIARHVGLPLFVLTGLFDPIVPWYPARCWFRRNCPTLRSHHVLWSADHNVLGTAPASAATQILQWIFTPLANGPAHSYESSHRA